MEKLLTDGVCVISVPSARALHTYVPTILSEVKEVYTPATAVLDLPFEISPTHPAQFVLGSYGALGLPSVTHHPLVREIRQTIYEALFPLFVEQFPGRKLEVLFDRFSVRRKGASISGESFHRDVGPTAHNDMVFGGWFNLDALDKPAQNFSGLPGNVLPLNAQAQGFAKMTKAEQKALENELKRVGPIAIPPAHIILFNQTIAHKITAVNKAKFTSYRLYFGWRITDSDVPSYDKQSIIDQQSVPPLPSGEIAPMYALLHWVNWQERLFAFSRQFKMAFIDPVRGCVMREMPGLVATNEAFAPYSARERAMFFPTLLPAPLEADASPCKRRRLEE
jgi:hypothetical protein